MISFPAFVDEFIKIALDAGAIQRAMKGIARSSGELGSKMVPKSQPMTAYFRGGKMIKVPHGSPPPLPKLSSGGGEAVEIPVGSKAKWKAFKSGLRGEVGPAAGATLGAGLAAMYGVNPLAGAAAGYGAGAMPDIIAGIRARLRK